jgi:hypothetical protein
MKAGYTGYLLDYSQTAESLCGLVWGTPLAGNLSILSILCLGIYLHGESETTGSLLNRKENGGGIHKVHTYKDYHSVCPYSVGAYILVLT